MALHTEELLVGMRSGLAQPAEAIAAFVQGVVDGSISRPQAAAWLAWAFARGLSDDETVALTRAMTRSGEILAWPDGPELCDKHSTGGVGDKVSLILAPLWAELGRRVPMLSGRGLGHTGGTLDKLEAIPGYRTDLPIEHLRRQLADVGCFITGQTGDLAPADRTLYALRNEIQAVESIPLIVGSILSKKLAAGVRHLVLDVKSGSGAFMKRPEDARALAEALVRVATSYGVRCEAWITEMDRPLGITAGNALEVEEAIACLQGGGPADLRELTLALAGDPRAAGVLDSGAAYERFARMVAAQGGRLDEPLLGAGVEETPLLADRDGVVQRADAFELGRAAFVLGAGRRRAEDPVDFGVGLRCLVKPGDRVARGQPLVSLVHRAGRALEEARALCADAVQVGDAPVHPAPLVHARVGG
jgi:pyrimidine-nucleoside phosphorylase